MNYAKIRHADIANGEGVRVSLFVSGCRNHCKNCFNRETWNFDYGAPFTEETAKEIVDALSPDYIQGLTILGGEPLEPENQPAVLSLIQRVRREFPQKDIWLYTGFEFEEVIGQKLSRICAPQIACSVDVLVDGRFDDNLRNISLKYRGSSNQRIIDIPKTVRSGQIALWKG